MYSMLCIDCASSMCQQQLPDGGQNADASPTSGCVVKNIEEKLRLAEDNITDKAIMNWKYGLVSFTRSVYIVCVSVHDEFYVVNTFMQYSTVLDLALVLVHCATHAGELLAEDRAGAHSCRLPRDTYTMADCGLQPVGLETRCVKLAARI